MTHLAQTLSSRKTGTQRCGLCNSEDVKFLFTAKDRNRQVDESEFSIARCSNCGVGFTAPMLSGNDLSRYYTREYYSLDGNLKLESAIRKYNQIRIDKIRRFVSAGKLLDVGAGTGMFLKTAKANGFEVEGLELSSDAATFGNEVWGLNIRAGSLHETTFAPKSYDVVTLGHVLEHLHKPQEALHQLHPVLRNNGLLVIAVPNFASIQSELFRSNWFHLDVPRHLFHYSPSMLKALVENAGFKTLDINFFSAEHNWAGFLGSIMKLSRPGETFPHKFVRKIIGMPITRALAYGESVIGRGGTFELYAVKQ